MRTAVQAETTAGPKPAQLWGMWHPMSANASAQPQRLLLLKLLTREHAARVMINLLKNAAESGSRPEDISVCVRDRVENFVVEVADRGSGLANRPDGSAGAVVTLWLPSAGQRL
jgi:hypothetical protein